MLNYKADEFIEILSHGYIHEYEGGYGFTKNAYMLLNKPGAPSRIYEVINYFEHYISNGGYFICKCPCDYVVDFDGYGIGFFAEFVGENICIRSEFDVSFSDKLSAFIDSKVKWIGIEGGTEEVINKCGIRIEIYEAVSDVFEDMWKYHKFEEVPLYYEKDRRNFYKEIEREFLYKRLFVYPCEGKLYEFFIDFMGGEFDVDIFVGSREI